MIKTPHHAARTANWSPSTEARRLAALRDLGTPDPRYEYLAAINYCDDPPFIILPYFESVNLRELIDITRDNIDDKAGNKLKAASELLGNWLGDLYSSTEKENSVNKTIGIDFMMERISELRCGPINSQSARRLQAISNSIALADESDSNSTKFRPIFGHGDLVPDNVLVSDSGQICLIDPEPIKLGGFSDFFRFKEYLAILAYSRRSRGAVAAATCAKIFVSSFNSSYPRHNIVAREYFKHVLAKVAWYHASPLNKLSFRPRTLVAKFNNMNVARYWLRWLQDCPDNETELSEYIENTI